VLSRERHRQFFLDRGIRLARRSLAQAVLQRCRLISQFRFYKTCRAEGH
jgi:hypothetical protein